LAHDTGNKVAAVTLGSWAIKICATTLGETGGDLLARTSAQGGLGLVPSAHPAF